MPRSAAALQRVGKTAGPRAFSTVCAAPSQHGREVALARNAVAQGAVTEGLDFKRSLLAQRAQLLARQLAPRHGAGAAETPHALHGGQRVGSGLRGRKALEHAHEPCILHDDGVHTQGAQLPEVGGHGRQLQVADKRVDRDVAAHAVLPAEGDGARHVLPFEILGEVTGVEAAAAEIDGVGPRGHGGIQCLRGAGRRQNFHGRRQPRARRSSSSSARSLFISSR